MHCVGLPQLDFHRDRISAIDAMTGVENDAVAVDRDAIDLGDRRIHHHGPGGHRENEPAIVRTEKIGARVLT